MFEGLHRDQNRSQGNFGGPILNYGKCGEIRFLSLQWVKTLVTLGSSLHHLRPHLLCQRVILLPLRWEKDWLLTLQSTLVGRDPLLHPVLIATGDSLPKPGIIGRSILTSGYS